MLAQILISALAMGMVSAMPQATAVVPSTTAAPSSAITSAASLTCSSGSTAKTVQDCTYPTILSSFCSSIAPNTCSSGSFPGSVPVNAGECAFGVGCVPLTALSTYTTTCNSAGRGSTAYFTDTIFSGTLAGESTATVITSVACECPRGDSYESSSYCMAHTDCGAGMTTSTSVNSFCQTQTNTYLSDFCATAVQTTMYCQCATGTPVYPATGGAPTTCV